VAIPPLRAPTFAESVVIDSYKGAATGAIASADSVADKIVTASVSVATAFGAVVALVTPKDSTSGYVIAIPFVLLAAAVGTSLYAQSIAVPINLSDDLATVKSSIDDTIKSKRLWGRIGLGALAIGILIAALVLASTYRESKKAKAKTTAVTLWLTSSGEKTVQVACGRSFTSPLKGTVTDPAKLSGETIVVKVGKKACPAGAATLVLPRKAVALATH
jgi:hypothetical protein